MAAKSIADLLASVGVKDEVFPARPGQSFDDLALNFARVFLGFYALKTGLAVVVCDKVAETAAEIFKEQKVVVPPGDFVKPNAEENNRLTALLSDIQMLNCVNVTGFHSIAWLCINMAVVVMSPSSTEIDLKDAHTSLSRPMTEDPPLAWADSSVKLVTLKNLLSINTDVGAIVCGRAAVCKAFTAAHADDLKLLLVLVPSNIFHGPTSPFVEMEYRNTWYQLWVSGTDSNPMKEVNVIGTKTQLNRMHTIARESFIGPNEEDYCKSDWPDGRERLENGLGAHFAKEREYLLPKTSDVIAGCKKLDEDDKYAFDELNGSVDLELGESKTPFRIEHHQSLFRLFERGKLIAVFDGAFSSLRQFTSKEGMLVRVPSFSDEHPSVSNEQASTTPAVSFVLKPSDNTKSAVRKFVPPLFGVTSLGSYNSIHCQYLTTGFLLWIGGSCIVVDPPPHCDKILERNHITVKHIILTHLHINFHDGLHPLLLGKERATLYTTETILRSYSRCSIAATGRDLLDHCDVQCIKISEPLSVCNALFIFNYALHTIPALSFRVRFGGRMISFSGANMYNPMIITKMYKDGIITARRREVLLHAVFDADMILCNVANNELPHTSLAMLDLLPNSIKRRLLLLNFGDRSLTPDECSKHGMRLLQTGLENTRSIDISDFEMGRASTISMVHLFCSNPLSKKLPVDMLPTILNNFLEHSFADGETIVGDDMNDNNSMLWLVSSGSALLYSDGELLTEMRSGDLFAYFEESHTQVIANNNCKMFMCSRSVLTGRHGQDLLQAVKMHAFAQACLTKSNVFGTLDPSQLSLVASCVSEIVHFAKDEKIIRQGDRSDRSMFIVHSGTVRVEVSSPSLSHPLEFARLGPGSIVGEMAFLLHQPRSADVVACVPTTTLRIKEEDMNSTLMMFPNIRFLLTTLASSRIDDAPVTTKRAPPPSSPRTTSSPRSSNASQHPPTFAIPVPATSNSSSSPGSGSPSPLSPSSASSMSPPPFSRGNNTSSKQNSGFVCPAAPKPRIKK